MFSEVALTFTSECVAKVSLSVVNSVPDVKGHLDARLKNKINIMSFVEPRASDL